MGTMVFSWEMLTTMGVIVVWLVRLEAKVLYLEQDRKDHWEKIDRMQTKLNEIAELLARLEGKFENHGQASDVRGQVQVAVATGKVKELRLIPSNPKVTPEAIAAIADAEAAAAKKKKTITCVKGKLVKKVTAVKPKCPSGYRAK